MVSPKSKGIEIRRVSTGKDWEEFHSLPFRVYSGDPGWAPPLRATVAGMLDVERNPFFRHAYACPLLVLREGRAVGRLVAFVDENHNRVHRDRVGFFGFFECEDDPDAAQVLVAAGERWLAERGADRVRGPLSNVPHCDIGLRVKGRGDAAFLTSYHRPYYSKLLEGAGFRRFKDLYSYDVDADAKVPERLLKHAERVRRARGVRLRPLDEKRRAEELEEIRAIYNSALERHWSFVPLGREEFGFFMDSLKPILEPDLVLLAEVRGKTAGFAVAIPDLNPVLRSIGDGRLWPKGAARLWWDLKGPGRRHAIRRCRILALGVRKEYAHYGVGPLLYAEFLSRGPVAGCSVGVIADVPEDDAPMNRALTRLCGEPREVRRLYEKPIVLGGK